jgi:hypothetical protein
MTIVTSAKRRAEHVKRYEGGTGEEESVRRCRTDCNRSGRISLSISQ